MNEDEILRALRACNEFSDFEEEEMQQIAAICDHVEYEKGERVFSITHEGQYVFVVASGELSLRLHTNAHKALRPGDLFGEIGVFSNQGRLGTIKAREHSSLIAIHRDDLLSDRSLSLPLRYKVLLSLTRKAISYFYNNDPKGSVDLIKKGEGESVEFKESAHKRVIDRLVRTIAAFMNLNGGVLFIGVKDNGEILGMEQSKEDIDKFQRDLFNMIRVRLGRDFAPLVSFDVELIDQKLIYRIDVDSARSPVFYREQKGGEEREVFIVRTGSTNNNLLKASKIIRYIQAHYKS